MSIFFSIIIVYVLRGCFGEMLKAHKNDLIEGDGVLFRDQCEQIIFTCVKFLSE